MRGVEELSAEQDTDTSREAMGGVSGNEEAMIAGGTAGEPLCKGGHCRGYCRGQVR